MATFLNLAEILVSVALIALVAIQAQGRLGGVFGGGGIQYTRRGLEKTLFNLTVVTAIAFVLVAILNALFT